MSKNYEAMKTEELQAELVRLKDNLCDLEDTHAFTFGRTSVHIGAEQAQNMQLEYDEECGMYKREIEAVESVLRKRGAA